MESNSIAIPQRFERWPIDRLQPYEKNPRTHSPAQIKKLAASLREYGFTNPVLVDSRDGIVAGHGRLQAARMVGLTEVPVVVLDHLTEAQRRAYIIADNRLAEDAGWDEQLLVEEMEALQLDGFDLELTGFDTDEIEDLLEDDESDDLDADPRIDEAEELRREWGTETGQIWTLGRHRILCGDSTAAADVARLLDGESAECLWTDPPYNVAYVGKAGQGRIANDSMDAESFGTFLRGAFNCAFAALKPGGAAYIAHADTAGLTFRREFIAAGFKLSSCLIWRKNSMVLGRSDWQWSHEPILYGWKPGAAHRWYGGRDQTTILDEDRPSRSTLHPTMKPVSLIVRMLISSTKRKDIVLDLFGGSGSTLIACERLGRCARIVELDPKFVAVTLQRYVDATGKQPQLAATSTDAGAFLSPESA